MRLEYKQSLYIRMIELMADTGSVDVLFPHMGAARGMVTEDPGTAYEVQVIGEEAYLDGRYVAPLWSQEYYLAILEIAARKGSREAESRLVEELVSTRHPEWEEYLQECLETAKENDQPYETEHGELRDEYQRERLVRDFEEYVSRKVREPSGYLVLEETSVPEAQQATGVGTQWLEELVNLQVPGRRSK